MYSNPGAGAVTPSRAARSSRESSARDHPSLALPRKDSVQISHARDPTLLYLHCEREGETEKTINKICALLEQCVARGMNPLRMRQVSGKAIWNVFLSEKLFGSSDIAPVDLHRFVCLTDINYGNLFV